MTTTLTTPRRVTRAASVDVKGPEGWVWCPSCNDYRFTTTGGRSCVGCSKRLPRCR